MILGQLREKGLSGEMNSGQPLLGSGLLVGLTTIFRKAVPGQKFVVY